MTRPRFNLQRGTLVSGFIIGLICGAIMALLWPSQPRVEGSVRAPSTARPLIREAKRIAPTASNDSALANVDPLTISKERGQQAARHRRQELGLN